MQALRRTVAIGLTTLLAPASALAADTIPDLSAACTPPCVGSQTCQAGVCITPPEPPAKVETNPKPETNATGQVGGTAGDPKTSPEQPATPGAHTESGNLPGDENFIPSWVHTSDFVDTRLTFLLANSNLLAKPGETTPNAPGTGIAGGGSSSQFNQFYDNFNTRYTGFENLSNLVLYKKSDTFIRGLTAEAALALTLVVLAERNNSQSQSTALQDASSYIRLKYVPLGWNPEKEGIAFTGFPLSADRMRLGYAYKISWGGTSIFPNQGNSVPGAKLQINKGNFYGYVGAKTTLIFNEQIHEQEARYAVLAGAGYDILPELRIEANGGYFQKGVNPEPQVLGVPVNARGVSAEVVYHKGEPVGVSADFKLYQNDPNHYINFFRPEKYPGGLSVTASLEGSLLQQTLADPDISGATKLQNAEAGALQLRMKYDKLRVSLLGLVRSLSFIQFNVPGFPPFFDFPSNTSQSPEAFVAVGADYYIESLHLTPGLIAGVQRPASFSTENTLGGNNPPAGLLGKRTVVVTDTNAFTVLPSGADPTLVISLKGNARMQLSEYFAAVGEAYFTVDNNRTTFKDDSQGVSEPSFEKPYILGFNLLLQARF